MVIFMSLPIYPRGNSLWYTLDRKLGVPQSRSGCNNNNNNNNNDNNNVRFEVVTAVTAKVCCLLGCDALEFCMLVPLLRKNPSVSIFRLCDT
jgi:hypothetical protein